MSIYVLFWGLGFFFCLYLTYSLLFSVFPTIVFFSYFAVQFSPEYDFSSMKRGREVTWW